MRCDGGQNDENLALVGSVSCWGHTDQKQNKSLEVQKVASAMEKNGADAEG